MNDRRHEADEFAQALRGFGLLGILAIVFILLSGNVFIDKVIIPLGAILVLLWVRMSHTPWTKIGYTKLQNGFLVLILGFFAGIVFKLILKSIIMPLLGAHAVNQTYHYLTGNTAQLPLAIWTMLIVGFAEETVFRGFLFERFYKIWGTALRAKIFIILLTSLLFGWAHYTDQGWHGVVQAIMVGLVFGTIYSFTSRIWELMVAHTSFNLTALALIYWDAESAVGNFFFN